jgi:hypothetical protein
LGADNAGCPSMCGCNKLGKFLVGSHCLSIIHSLL